MSGIKITDLPAAPSAQLTDVFPVDQGATTYKESNTQLLTLFKANGAALTKTDDTNVTMTLGGSPTTALLNATSMTLGWTGQLSVPRGGTGNSTFTSYSVICAGTTATGAFQNVSGVGSANQVLVSNGAAALPTWQSVPGLTPAALTKVDDTNVTLTLGGTPTTALLQATSITAGWTGTLAETRGGTAQSTYTTGDTLYSSAANTLSKLSGNITTTKQYLSQTGNGAVSAAPAWATVSGTDITGAALTKADDTNVTLTLGGTPTTALLRAASITAGWTGTLSGTRGGTGVNNGASTITLGGSLTTVGAFASTFTMTGTTGVTFPTSGTLATTSQIPTGAALTKTDDTNVTATLGGSPTTALVNAASITLGWTGTLSGTRGGTGVNNGASTITLGGSLTTSGAFASTFTMTGTTGVTFPTSGTLATTSQIPTGAALTKTDDTNVTATLGGSPTTALVNAASITLGWTGQLAASRGGTGISSLGTGVATALGTNVNGSGAISLTTSPTFVTPVLGAATATSINFGQTTLSTYQEGTWTPTDTSGASLSFSTAIGTYTRIGRMVVAGCNIAYPATVSGANAQIGGLPFTVANNNGSLGGVVMFTTVSTAAKTMTVPNTTTANIYNSAGAQILNSALTLSTNYFQYTYFV